MPDDFKENLISIFTSRLIILFVLIIGIGAFLIHRVFELQIVNGESYLENFAMTIEKTRTLKSARGNIYDRNG